MRRGASFRLANGQTLSYDDLMREFDVDVNPWPDPPPYVGYSVVEFEDKVRPRVARTLETFDERRRRRQRAAVVLLIGAVVAELVRRWWR